MINDVKWVQAQRHASDWRHALDIAVRPLITFGAAAPCYRCHNSPRYKGVIC